MSNNGLRLLSFAAAYRFGVANSWFRHHHKTTWRSNDMRTRKQLDYILISRRFGSSLQDVKVVRGADLDSDHDLVVAKLAVKLNVRRPSMLQKPLDVSALKSSETRNLFQAELRNRLSAIAADEHLEAS